MRVEPLLADQRDAGGAVDVLVVPLGRLGRRREQRLGQLVGLAQAARQRRARRPTPVAR